MDPWLLVRDLLVGDGPPPLSMLRVAARAGLVCWRRPALVSRAVPLSAAVHTPAVGRVGPSASFTKAGPGLEREANQRSYDVQDVVRWLEEEHAFDVCYLEVKGLMDGAVGDWLVFGSARTEGHMKRTAKAVVHELKKREVRLFGRGPEIEGGSSDEWMLVDGGSIIVNVMIPHARAALNLEQHWQKLGAPMVQTESRHGPHAEAAEAAAAVAAGSGLDALSRDGEPGSGGTPGGDEAVYGEGEGVDWRGVEELQQRRGEGGAEASAGESADEYADAELAEGKGEEYEEYEEYDYDDDDDDYDYDDGGGDDDYDGEGDDDYDYDYDYDEGEVGGAGARPKASGDGGGRRSAAAGGGRASRPTPPIS